jgi:hypothetical protein
MEPAAKPEGLDEASAQRSLAIRSLGPDQELRRDHCTENQARELRAMEFLQLPAKLPLPKGPDVDVGVKEAHRG